MESRDRSHVLSTFAPEGVGPPLIRSLGSLGVREGYARSEPNARGSVFERFSHAHRHNPLSRDSSHVRAAGLPFEADGR